MKPIVYRKALSLATGALALLCLTCPAAEPPDQGPAESGDTAQSASAAIEPESSPDSSKAQEKPLAKDPPSEEQLSQARMKRDQALATLNRLESSESTYSGEFLEAWLELGDALQTLGLHNEALNVLGNAMQTIRINNGLNNTQQLPVIDRMLASAREIGDWESVDNNHHLKLHIISQNFPPGHRQRVSATLETGRWTVEAVDNKWIGELALSEAAALYRNELKLLEAAEAYDAKGLDIANLALDSAAVAYYQASQTMQKPLMDYQTGMQPTTIRETRCRTYRTADGQLVQICEEVEIPNINYLLDPNNQKMAEVNRYLSEMKKSINQAYDALKMETTQTEQRDQLLLEIRQMVEIFNDFMDKHQ